MSNDLPEPRKFAAAIARDMDDLKREKAALREQCEELLDALQKLVNNPPEGFRIDHLPSIEALSLLAKYRKK